MYNLILRRMVPLQRILKDLGSLNVPRYESVIQKKKHFTGTANVVHCESRNSDCLTTLISQESKLESELAAVI